MRVVRTDLFTKVALAGALVSGGCYDGLDAHAGADDAAGSGASDGVGGDAGEGGDSDGGVDGTEVVVEPLHRLNQLEYDNTVRDLLGTTLTPAQGFPPDPAVGGFDNVAAGLTLAPQLMDLYASAAREVAADALVTRPRYAIDIGARAHAEQTGQGGNAFDWGWSLPRGGGGALSFDIELAQAEDVTISILAGGDAVGRPTPEMGVQIDGVEVGHWVVTSLPATPAVYTTTTSIAAGPHSAAITFPNGDDQPADNVFNSLVVGDLKIESAALFTPPGRALVYVCEPSEQLDPRPCYHEIVTRFAARAWRRPLTDDEAQRITLLWEELAVRETGDDAVLLVVRALLVSSKFLYRASLPDPDALDGHETELVPLDDYALASRLSYFLWSSMPDDALFGAAAAGHLRSEGGIRAQVQRMLADSKAEGLRRGFAAQWLATRTLARHQPDPTMFPSFDEALRVSMTAEAELFFADFLGNGLPIAEMMTPDFGYRNDRLATHYGLALPESSEMVRVDLDDGDRRGLLEQGAWLVASSASTRTSPVVRGRWMPRAAPVHSGPAAPARRAAARAARARRDRARDAGEAP